MNRCHAPWGIRPWVFLQTFSISRLSERSTTTWMEAPGSLRLGRGTLFTLSVDLARPSGAAARASIGNDFAAEHSFQFSGHFLAPRV